MPPLRLLSLAFLLFCLLMPALRFSRSGRPCPLDSHPLMNIQGLIGWLEYTEALDPCQSSSFWTRIRFTLLSAGVLLVLISMSGRVLGHLVSCLLSLKRVIMRGVAPSLQHVSRGLIHPYPSYLSGNNLFHAIRSPCHYFQPYVS